MNKLLLSFLLLTASDAFAHANLKVGGLIPPRSADTGLKVGPCGNIPRTAVNKALVMGSTVTVEWQETINHPGRFEFYLSTANDANFQLLKTVQDDQNNPVAGGVFHQYSTTLTFPAGVQCTNCTLQMIQVMTENPANPTYYYSCADISLQATVTPAPTPTPTPTPTPSPSPNPNTGAPGNSCPP